MRKFLGTCVVLFLIFYAVTNPAAAASSVKALAGWAVGFANDVAAFIAAF